MLELLANERKLHVHVLCMYNMYMYVQIMYMYVHERLALARYAICARTCTYVYETGRIYVDDGNIQENI